MQIVVDVEGDDATWIDHLCPVVGDVVDIAGGEVLIRQDSAAAAVGVGVTVAVGVGVVVGVGVGVGTAVCTSKAPMSLPSPPVALAILGSLNGRVSPR